MKDTGKRDSVLLRRIIARCDEALSDMSYAGTQEAFLRDSRTQRAMAMSVGQIGELVKQVSVDLKQAHPEVGRDRMRRLRDLLYRDYYNVRWAAFWQESYSALPCFREACANILGSLTTLSARCIAPKELRWGLDNNGVHILYYAHDRARIIARVFPQMVSSSVTYWVAEAYGNKGFVRFAPR